MTQPYGKCRATKWNDISAELTTADLLNEAGNYKGEVVAMADVIEENIVGNLALTSLCSQNPGINELILNSHDLTDTVVKCLPYHEAIYDMHSVNSAKLCCLFF